MIRKGKEGYHVLSESGRHMGTYKTLKEAKHRLKQIEFFKHVKKNPASRPLRRIEASRGG